MSSAYIIMDVNSVACGGQQEAANLGTEADMGLMWKPEDTRGHQVCWKAC